MELVQRIVVRILGFLLLLVFITGFRTFNYRWDISPDDPTVWIRFCQKPRFPTLSFEYVVDTIMDDYNSVGTSFVRLEWYPEDADNPPVQQPGQSIFTKDKASIRTIDVCFGEAKGLASGGHAQFTVSSNSITHCEIVLIDALKNNSSDFVRTLTHEIGHCMGLDHPQETKNAVMSYYQSTDSRPGLQDDDKMGLTYLYPKQEGAGSETPNFGLGCAPIW